MSCARAQPPGYNELAVHYQRLRYSGIYGSSSSKRAHKERDDDDFYEEEHEPRARVIYENRHAMVEAFGA